MASPFPGMDPYLEDSAIWAGFQHQLAHSLYQILLPGLMDRYRARVAQRHYVNEQAVARPSSARSITSNSSKSASATTAGWSRWSISSARPTKPLPPAGPLTWRNAARPAPATHNLVEIDLVMQGQPMHEYSREGLPDWDYAVTVTRPTQPERYEILHGHPGETLAAFSHAPGGG